MADRPFDSFDTSDFFDKPSPRPLSIYPRTYLPSRRWKLLLTLLGLALAIPSAFGAYYFGSGNEVDTRTGLLFFTALGGGFLMLGLYCIAVAFKSRFTLHGNEIEYREPLRTLHIPRAEIGAYRYRSTNGVTYLELQPANAGGRKRQLSVLFERDGPFYDWFDGIADADEEEYAQSVQEVETDGALGTTPEARLARAGHARKMAGVLGALALSLPVLTIFISHPALLYTLILLPWLAIVLRLLFGAAFTLAEKNKTARGDLSALLFMPGIGLALIALQGIALLDWTQLILPTVAGTLLMLGLAAGVSPELRRSRVNLALLPLLLFAYPAGLLAIADVRLDQAPAERFVMNVTARHTTHDKLGTHYHFNLTGWGYEPRLKEAEVTEQLYRAVEPGGWVCIHRHPGWLDMAWYEVWPQTACRTERRQVLQKGGNPLI